MTTELLPEVKEEEVAAVAQPEPTIPDPAAPTQAEAVTEPESPPADLEAVTTKFLQDRGYELPTQDSPVQNSVVAPEALTPEQVETRATEIANQRIAEQQRQQAEQGTVVDYRNRAERIRGTLARVASGDINLADLIPNTTVTWAQAISNEFDNHHAQASRVSVNGFVQNLWADLAQDIPEADRKGWLERRTQDKTLADLRNDYKAAVTKGMITEAESKKRASAQAAKDLLEYKALIAPLLPGYVPPVAGGNTPAGGSTELSLEDALNLPIDKLVAYQARQSAG